MIRRVTIRGFDACVPLSGSFVVVTGCCSTSMQCRRTAVATNHALWSLATYGGLSSHKALLKSHLQQARDELSRQHATKIKLESQARRYPDTLAAASFAYFVGQTGLLFYWVYFRFDWNLVEPITYLLAYSVVWLSLACFYATGKEFTFDNVRCMLAERKVKKLFSKHQFDLESYQKLEARVADLEKQVEQLQHVQ